MAKKSRKVFATTATAALVASAVAPIASSAAGFSDVTKPEYKEAIDALAQAGIINGYENGTFKPENKVTRGEVAKVITLIRHLEEGTKTPFKDVKDGYWSTQYINSLYAAKLVNGYEDGTFKPEGNVTRAEFAKLVVDAYGLTLTNAATPFTDVKAGNWATPYIQTAYANGLIKGVTASKFDPSAPIKRGDLAILLHRADSKFGDVIGNNFPGVELVKATNNTTVEVTFKNAVEAKDVKAANFSIEGLTVSNAAVKQTDSKTVVLTTSAQEGGKQYTVKSGSATLGKFIGASAVVPKSIKVTTPSVQGTIGKEVTLKAEVTVEDGKSKAGIPVTFNIVSDNTNLNSKIEVEALTDENGVASYSYTRYYKHNDNVVAYATSKSDVSSNGKVYWADALAIKEVTEGNDLSNNSKKVYKVTGDADTWYNVTFEENLNVTPDKVVGAKVIDAHYGNNTTPYQLTSGAVNSVAVKTNASGEATFAVTGSNEAVTPIVFKNDSSTVNNHQSASFQSTELFAKAPKVTFSDVTYYDVKVEAQGEEYAAFYNTTNGNGGRDYKVTIKGKDGKPAAKGEEFFVFLDETASSSDSYLLDASKNVVRPSNGTTGKVVKLVVENNAGEATFTVYGQSNTAYATPVVFLDRGTSDRGSLSKNDLKATGSKTFFKSPVASSVNVKYYDANGKEITTAKGAATVKLSVLDQNGKVKVNENTSTSNYQARFEVENTSTKVLNVGTTPVTQDKVVKLINVSNGEATIDLTTNDSLTAKIYASYNGLTTNGTLEFKSTSEVADFYTGNVVGFDTEANTITFDGYAPTSYSDDKDKVKFYMNNTEVTEDAFTKALKVDSVVTYTKYSDGTVSYKIVTEGVGASLVDGAPVLSSLKVTSTDKNLAIGEKYEFTLTFSEAVAYKGTGIDVGAGTAAIDPSTNNTKELKFVYTVSAGDTDGATVSPVINAAEAAKFIDTDNNGSGLATLNIPTGYVIDTVAPTVATKLAAAADLTANTSIVFSEAIDTASRDAVKSLVDAALTKSGDATFTTAWATDNKTLNITVTPGTGTVTLAALNVPANFTVKDIAGNASASLAVGDLQN